MLKTWSGEAFPLGFYYHIDFTPHSAIVWASKVLLQLLATSCLTRSHVVCSSAKKFRHVSCKSRKALGGMSVPTLFSRSILVIRAWGLGLGFRALCRVRALLPFGFSRFDGCDLF